MVVFIIILASYYLIQFLVWVQRERTGLLSVHFLVKIVSQNPVSSSRSCQSQEMSLLYTVAKETLVCMCVFVCAHICVCVWDVFLNNSNNTICFAGGREAKRGAACLI